MIVQVIQLEIDPLSRSRTLQRAMRAIDEAADLDPAPDLIALPAFGNALAAIAGEAANFEQAPGMITASCGLRGRSWGVFLTVGLAERSSACKPHLTGMLLDRDADIRLLQRMTTTVNKQFKKAFEPSDRPIKVGRCLLGQFALLVGDDILSASHWEHAVASGAQMIIGATCWPKDAGDDTTAVLAQYASNHAVPCVLADCTTANQAEKDHFVGRSCVIDATGAVLVSAPPHQSASLQAEIALAEPKVLLEESLTKQ